MARSARTTANLKERVADALLELMSAKPYEDISISEITDLADVGRTTYYRHFSSKDDILDFKFETIFGSILKDKLHRGHHPDISREELEAAFREQLDKIYSNRKTFEIVYAAKLDYLLFRYIYRYATADPQSDEIFDRYRIAFHAATVFALTDQWISSGFVQTPEDLSAMLISQGPHRRHSEMNPDSHQRDNSGTETTKEA